MSQVRIPTGGNDLVRGSTECSRTPRISTIMVTKWFRNLGVGILVKEDLRSSSPITTFINEVFYVDNDIYSIRIINLEIS